MSQDAIVILSLLGRVILL